MSDSLASNAQVETHVSLPAACANPITVEVTRGPMVESRHRGCAVVVDPRGRVVMGWGEYGARIYPRSAIKALQAIPLVETGAAAAFGLGAREIALACASHGAEPAHIATLEAWLKRIGLRPQDLECGPHWPLHEPSMRAMVAAGATPGAVHNNCSGKHAGFLTVARHLGIDIRGYVHPEHPVQQRVAQVLETLCDVDLRHAPRGTDGCSIPTFGIPLRNLALAMARIAAPNELPPARADAVRRILGAIAAEPFMVAGSDRYCTRLMAAAGRKIMVKTGAEGVFCAALPECALGVALKCDDGAARASQLMMTAVLRKIGVLDDALAGQFADLLQPALFDRNGRRVGEVRAGAAMHA